jgi:RimJ/RimL family protein N-acetyltransferase
MVAIHKETGRWIGKIDLIVHEDWPGHDKTEVGWELDPAFWGRGLATEGGTAAIRYGFTQLELPRIISVTTPENVASWRVMQKCGLRYQGRIHWRDVACVWYALDRADWVADIGGHRSPHLETAIAMALRTVATPVAPAVTWRFRE